MVAWDVARALHWIDAHPVESHAYGNVSDGVALATDALDPTADWDLYGVYRIPDGSYTARFTATFTDIADGVDGDGGPRAVSIRWADDSESNFQIDPASAPAVAGVDTVVTVDSTVSHTGTGHFRVFCTVASLTSGGSVHVHGRFYVDPA